MRSTKPASCRQKPHHVVQNSSSTTLPFNEALLNFSPRVVVALNRGAGSLGLVLPSTGPAVVQSRQETSKPKRAGRRAFRVLMARNFITEPCSLRLVSLRGYNAKRWVSLVLETSQSNQTWRMIRRARGGPAACLAKSKIADAERGAIRAVDE